MGTERLSNTKRYHQNENTQKEKNTVAEFDQDPELTPDIVNGLLHIWPKINSQKEVSMLSEMEELIEKLGLRDFENEQQRQEIFKKVMKPLFKQMAKCCCSTNFQVAEKALVLWNNEVFIHFFEQNNAELMAIVAVPLHYASKNHWNPQIAKLIQQVGSVNLETCQ